MGYLSYKTKQFFFVVIKFGIVGLAFHFIYQKLIIDPKLELQTFVQFIYKKDLFTFDKLGLLLILTVLNWVFEIVKWQTLVKSFTQITFSHAAEQSLGSLTASIFTPNRIGEYGAKAIYFNPAHRKSIVALNFLGNMMQMSMTVLFGVLGLFLFQTRYNTQLLHINLIWGLVIGLIITMVLIGFKNGNTYKIKWFSLKKLQQFYQRVPKQIYVLGSLYALMRYLIFSFQFYVVLNLFTTQLSYLDSMVIITIMYLLASIIPTLFIFDVVIKSSIALYLFSFAGIDALPVLSVVTLMWLLNFGLPAIIGSYLVLKFELPKYAH